MTERTTTWKKGQSGNPKGKPKGATNVIPSQKKITASLKEGSTDVIKKLRQLANSDDEKVRANATMKIFKEARRLFKQCEKEGKRPRKGDIRYEFIASLEPSLIELKLLMETAESEKTQLTVASLLADSIIEDLEREDAVKASKALSKTIEEDTEEFKAPVLKLTAEE